jgi:flagellar FliJ protein
MTNAFSLRILIDQAANDTDAALRRVQDMAGELLRARRQLSELHGYRHDYTQRLQSTSLTGLSASNYQNFRRFIATLDQAIVQQNGVVAQIETRLERERDQWRAHKRRLNAYEALRERNLRQQRTYENRREQRASDELSSNLARRTALPH